MGKLIMCSGARTKRPYSFPSSGVRLYSIEELCYYLYHHVYLIDEELFSDALIDWLQNELQLADRAWKLRQLKEKQADAKTMLTVILCSADYYTEYEIKSLLKEFDGIADMPKVMRNCIKANHCLKHMQYKEAEAEYERLLASKEATELSLIDYGDILHNLAIARMHTTGYHMASSLFEQAYIRNRREDTLRQFLFTLLIINNEELYRKKLQEHEVDEILQHEVEAFMDQKKEEAVQSGLMNELHNLRQIKLQGRMKDYYNRTEELIESWKGKIRQI